MPKYTIMRRTVEWYSVDSESEEQAYDDYMDGKAKLVHDETLEITVELDTEQPTKGESP